MPDTYLGSNSFNISDLTPFSAGFQNSWTNSLQPGKYDEYLLEEAPKAYAQQAQAQVESQAQPMKSTSFMPQRITRSKVKALGDEHHWMSLFVITFE